MEKEVTTRTAPWCPEGIVCGSDATTPSAMQPLAQCLMPWIGWIFAPVSTPVDITPLCDNARGWFLRGVKMGGRSLYQLPWSNQEHFKGS